ncbi:MAG: hypothetical protein QME81_17165 [bacterium]|nr:hypothetical protein [bacterium]
MAKDKYKVSQKDDWIDAIPIPTTHTVVVKDNATGQEVKASAATVEKATEMAWEKMEKLQEKK